MLQEQSRGMLPVLDDEQEALLDIDWILSKMHTQGCFDQVVGWLEDHISKGTFINIGKLPRCQALMNQLSHKFPTPPHHLETVMLETGTENVEHPNEYECGRAVKIPIWDFQEMRTHYLLDPVLVGNKDHLINSDNPFSKYVPEHPKRIKEYLASHHYSEMNDHGYAES
jgi:hypothetical protein